MAVIKSKTVLSMSKERGKLCQCFLFTYLGHHRCDQKTRKKWSMLKYYYFITSWLRNKQSSHPRISRNLLIFVNIILGII